MSRLKVESRGLDMKSISNMIRDDAAGDGEHSSLRESPNENLTSRIGGAVFAGMLKRLEEGHLDGGGGSVSTPKDMVDTVRALKSMSAEDQQTLALQMKTIMDENASLRRELNEGRKGSGSELTSLLQVLLTMQDKSEQRMAAMMQTIAQAIGKSSAPASSPLDSVVATILQDKLTRDPLEDLAKYKQVIDSFGGGQSAAAAPVGMDPEMLRAQMEYDLRRREIEANARVEQYRAERQGQFADMLVGFGQTIAERQGNAAFTGGGDPARSQQAPSVQPAAPPTPSRVMVDCPYCTKKYPVVVGSKTADCPHCGETATLMSREEAAAQGRSSAGGSRSEPTKTRVPLHSPAEPDDDLGDEIDEEQEPELVEA